MSSIDVPPGAQLPHTPDPGEQLSPEKIDARIAKLEERIARSLAHIKEKGPSSSVQATLDNWTKERDDLLAKRAALEVKNTGNSVPEIADSATEPVSEIAPVETGVLDVTSQNLESTPVAGVPPIEAITQSTDAVDTVPATETLSVEAAPSATKDNGVQKIDADNEDVSISPDTERIRAAIEAFRNAGREDLVDIFSYSRDRENAHEEWNDYMEGEYLKYEALMKKCEQDLVDEETAYMKVIDSSLRKSALNQLFAVKALIDTYFFGRIQNAPDVTKGIEDLKNVFDKRAAAFIAFAEKIAGTKLIIPELAIVADETQISKKFRVNENLKRIPEVRARVQEIIDRGEYDTSLAIYSIGLAHAPANHKFYRPCVYVFSPAEWR